MSSLILPSFEEGEGAIDINKMHHKFVLAVEVVVEPREEPAEQQIHQVQNLCAASTSHITN